MHRLVPPHRCRVTRRRCWLEERRRCGEPPQGLWLRTRGSQILTQNTTGVGDVAEGGGRGRFGTSVAVMSGSTHRLAVGTPYEHLGSATNAGIVQLFNFHNVASDRCLNQNTAGTPQGIGAVHVVNVSGGFASRAWVAGTGLIPGGATRFGRALSGYDDLG